MSRIRSSRRNLLGGVSQQPVATRPDSQCERQDNAYSSVVDGLIKRHPTQHVVGVASTGLFGSNVYWEGKRVHFIDRSPTERYIVMFAQDVNEGFTDGVRVWSADDGTEMTVTSPGASEKAYIGGNRAELELLTLRDTTYIVNKTYTVLKDTTLISDAFDINGGSGAAVNQSASSRRRFIFIRSTNYQRRYAVRLVVTDTSDNEIPSNNTAAQRELNVAWVKTFDGMGGGAGTGFEAAYGGANDIPPFEPLGSPPTKRGRQIGTIEPSEVLARLWDQPADLVGSPAVAETDYLGGIRAVFNRETETTSPNNLQDGASPPNYTALENLLTRGTRFEGRASSQTQSVPPMGGAVMMLEPRTDIQNDTSSSFLKTIDVEVVDDGGGQAGDMIVFGDEIQSFSDLPLHCKDGHVVKIKPEGDVPEHYVKFTMSPSTVATVTTGAPYDNDLPQGTWEETVASLNEYALDAGSMPHKLVRIVDPGEPKGFRWEIQEETWGDRIAGDDDSNPDPAFVGSTIQSVFFWRNRLGFITGNGKLVFSEAGEFTNFYRTTVTTTPDSDPIEVEVPARQGGAPRYAIPQTDSLVVFADQQQFVVTGEPVLSPKTISVKQVSEYDSLFDVQQVGTETGIYFPYPGAAGQFSQIGQLRRVGDSELYDRFEVTAQCPRYLAGRVVEMVANTIENVLVVRTDNDDRSNTLYVYKWFDSGRERVLSAWMRYTIGPSQDVDSGNLNSTGITDVIGMGFFDNDLYLMMKRVYEDTSSPVFYRNQLLIERIRFADQYQDPFPFDSDDPTDTGEATSNYLTLLDRRVTENDCTITYSHTNKQVQIELPYLLSSDAAQTSGYEKVVVVSRVNSNTGGSNGAATAEGVNWPVESVLHNATTSKTTVYIDDPEKALWIALGSPTTGSQSKDDRATRLFIGIEYLMDYQFSRFVIRESSQEGSSGQINIGRYRLRHLTLSFEDTGYFEVVVAPELREDGVTPVIDRDTVTYPLPQLEVGVGASWLGRTNIRDGQMKVPLLTEPLAVRVFLRNSTPFPSNVKTAEIEGEFNTRATQLFR